MKLRNEIMTVVVALSVLLTAGIARATIYTPPMDWPNNMTDTRNPLTDAQGGTWSAYTQARGQTVTGTYTLSQAAEWNDYDLWILPSSERLGFRTLSGTNETQFIVAGSDFTPADGWGVLAFQPAEGGSTVAISGEVSITKDWRTSYPLYVTAEVIKLNAAGDVAEVIAAASGITMAGGAWSFDVTTSMNDTDSIRVRVIDYEPNGKANGRVSLKNFQIDVTPEPVSLSLLAVGGLGVLFRRKA